MAEILSTPGLGPATKVFPLTCIKRVLSREREEVERDHTHGEHRQTGWLLPSPPSDADKYEKSKTQGVTQMASTHEARLDTDNGETFFDKSSPIPPASTVVAAFFMFASTFSFSPGCTVVCSMFGGIWQSTTDNCLKSPQPPSNSVHGIHSQKHIEENCVKVEF